MNQMNMMNYNIKPSHVVTSNHISTINMNNYKQTRVLSVNNQNNIQSNIFCCKNVPNMPFQAVPYQKF
jgi:hypothetical protein